MNLQTGRREGPLRVAIIGYGLAGASFHAPLIATTPGMEVSAVVTSNPERRQQVQQDFPGAELLERPDDIWQHAGQFDLVVVATPNIAHASLATASMRHRVPVVVDKPMALSVDEARALVAESEQTGVPLVPFQNRRWDGDFLTVRKLIREGRLGPITRFESRFERYRPAIRPGWREQTSVAEGGGLLWDLGSHLIDQALVLFGRQSGNSSLPERVYAEMPCRRPDASVDDDTFVALTFAGGITAHLWMSVTAAIPGPRFRVSGLGGAYEKYGLDPQETALRSGGRPGNEGWGREPESAWGVIRTSEADGPIETLPGAYDQFYVGVRDTIENGSPAPVDPRDVITTTQVIEAAQQSARTSTVVRL